MRVRHAFTRSVEVTEPARRRAEASDSVSAASVSGASLDDLVAAAPADCAAVSVATRVAAAAAPSTETVNSRRERCDMRATIPQSVDRTIGELANWRIGELANWRIGDLIR